MKQIYLVRKHYPRLLLFFAGWGADENLFRDYHPDESDFLLCYDYRSLAFDSSALASYREIRLVAWSMGVWAAAQVLSGLPLPLTKCIAVNGTPFPISDEKGIPEAVFNGTLEGFSPVTLQKFRRRMCGSTETVKAFLAHEPFRPLEELREELACLKQEIVSRPAAPFKWDKAVVGSRDKIIPACNQEAAWRDTETIVCDEEHYSEVLFREILEGM